MPSYAGIPIQLQVSTASSPPVNPIDVITGLPPAQWRANAVVYNVGIFDQNGNGVDLSSFSYLQLVVQAYQNAPTNLIAATVLAASITPVIQQGPWLAGTAQNAQFVLSAAQTDISLNAQPYQAYWIQLSGVTNAGALVVFGAGTVNFYNAGSATPAAVAGQTDFNAQTNNAGNGSVLPLSQLHTEQITVTGAARTSTFAVTSAAGAYAGALVNVAMILPATAGITINFTNQTTGGTQIASLTTDGYSLNAQAVFYLDNHGNYQPLSVTIPAR